MKKDNLKFFSILFGLVIIILLSFILAAPNAPTAQPALLDILATFAQCHPVAVQGQRWSWIGDNIP